MLRSPATRAPPWPTSREHARSPRLASDPVDDGSVADVLAGDRAATAVRVAALVRQVEGLAEQQALTSHDDEHDPEGVTIAVERAQLQGLLAGARRDLELLDRAAGRLRDGTYGRCLRCGATISPERLEALPAAETCRGCADRRRC